MSTPTSQRPYLRGCFGRSQKSGKEVGERHRWPDGWGKGRCEFCGRYLEDLLTKPAPAKPSAPPVVAAQPQRQEAPWPFPPSDIDR